MSAAKGQPDPQPTTDPIALAAADIRAAAADLRDKATELGNQIDAVLLERRAHAELVAERDRLIAENREHQKAVLLLLDQLFQTTGPQHADTNRTEAVDVR